MEYKLKINDFEGPLDLLLHLIKESKMDIFSIKIEVITEEYLNFIHSMEKLNLDIASEYLVMASELIELKSKMLLPRREEEEVEEDEISEESLIDRLVEYQRYKDLTSEFKKLEEDRKEILTKIPSSFSEYTDEDKKINNSDVTLDDLLSAFQSFLERQKEKQPISTKITKKELSVEERRVSIKNILNERKRISLFELFDVLTREYVVVTFLAVLEMARKHEIRLIQEKRFDDIICEVGNE